MPEIGTEVELGNLLFKVTNADTTRVIQVEIMRRGEADPESGDGRMAG